jgi:hypothetical protein
MGNSTTIRLWYLRSKQIFNLSGRSTRVILLSKSAAALEIRPICNQDRDAYTCGIACAGISYEKGLSRAVLWWRREHGDGVVRDYVYVGERGVDGIA